MTDPLLDPQAEYEAVTAALQRVHDAQDPAALTTLHEAIVHATAIWHRCEPLRTKREKEFRYQVVKLKLLLAGAHQTLEALEGAHLPKAA